MWWNRFWTTNNILINCWSITFIFWVLVLCRLRFCTTKITQYFFESVRTCPFIVYYFWVLTINSGVQPFFRDRNLAVSRTQLFSGHEGSIHWKVLDQFLYFWVLILRSFNHLCKKLIIFFNQSSIFGLAIYTRKRPF